MNPKQQRARRALVASLLPKEPYTLEQMKQPHPPRYANELDLCAREIDRALGEYHRALADLFAEPCATSVSRRNVDQAARKLSESHAAALAKEATVVMYQRKQKREQMRARIRAALNQKDKPC
jgi:DNA-binding transcriptional ArsR family regulator